VPIAALCLRDLPHYRFNAFKRGLESLGYTVEREPRLNPARSDVLMVWNRQGRFDNFARRYEKAGAAVLVAENGYLGTDAEGHHLFALALDHHNGAGRFPEGLQDRWSRLGVPLAPWRADGNHVLVLCQRGIGPAGVAMPRNWPASVARRIAAVTRRPVQMREHPGRFKTPLEPALQDCWCAVTWGSSAALKAIVAGVPVVHDLPGWIGAGAARHGLAGLDCLYTGDRVPMLQRLAWAQWTAVEIEAGEPIRRLLDLHQFRVARS